MRKEYDFSRMTGKKNPHARRLKKQVTIRLGIEAIEYFKKMSESLLKVVVNQKPATVQNIV